MIRYHQRSRRKEAITPPLTRYCGRPGRFGNSFSSSLFAHSKERALQLYQQMIEMFPADDPFFDELTAYDYLSCWCREGDPWCHVQNVLIPIAVLRRHRDSVWGNHA